MVTSDPTGASVRLLSDPLARLLVAENVYAATLLLDLISPARVRIDVKPLLEKAHWEIRNGDVSPVTLDRLVTLQTALGKIRRSL